MNQNLNTPPTNQSANQNSPQTNKIQENLPETGCRNKDTHPDSRPWLPNQPLGFTKEFKRHPEPLFTTNTLNNAIIRAHSRSYSEAALNQTDQTTQTATITLVAPERNMFYQSTTQQTQTRPDTRSTGTQTLNQHQDNIVTHTSETQTPSIYDILTTMNMADADPSASGNQDWITLSTLSDDSF